MSISGVRHKHTRTAGVVAALALTAASLAACTASAAGAGTDTSKSALSAAHATALASILKGAEANATWTDPGPAIPAGALAGKRIFALVDNQSIPFQTTLADGIKSAAKAAGVSVDVGDGQSDITKDIQILQNAVHDKYDAIVLGESVPSTIAPALKQAAAAHIPVISLLYGDPGQVLTSKNKLLGVVGDATYCYTCSGALAADKAISATKGHVDAVLITAVGSVLSTNIQAGFIGELKKLCPDTCKYKVVDVNLSNISQGVTSAAQVAAQDPDVNIVFPGVDFMVAYVAPPIRAAHADKRIMIVSTNADLAPMQQIAAGSAMKADIGNPISWDSWAAMDQAYRAIAGLATVADEKLPLRLFDDSNVKDVDLKAPADTWYGPVDFRAQYTKLWTGGK